MIVFIIDKPIDEVGEVYRELMKRYISITQSTAFSYDTIEPGIGMEIRSTVAVLAIEGRLKDYSIQLKNTMVVEDISNNSFLVTYSSRHGKTSLRISRYSIDAVITSYHESGYMFIAGV